jgi:hypothetical protein
VLGEVARAGCGGRPKAPAIITRLPYGSIMCSIPDMRIALIGQAIDELAEETRRGARRTTEGGTGSAADDAADDNATADDVAERLAAIWAMVAELDPGLAARLPRYAAPAD